MAERDRNGGKPEQQLREQQQQDRGIAERGVGADARVEQAAMRQQRDADQAHQPATPADDDRQHLLEAVRNAEPVEHPDRRQQADEMAEEDEEDADVEQVGAPHQLPAAQQLARSGPPGVLLAVEAEQAADDEDRQAEIGIPAEDD